ncbi:MAG: hypothetical protein LC722_06055 [Actinobacteria bacterium]|nr:hypothetical protein [Actinomycetota bacterium]
MAFRKEKIKEQFDSMLPQVLEPGESVQASSWTQSGPSPWLQGGVGLLILYLFGLRLYYVVVTDRRVLFLKGSLMTQRPQGLAWADPRGQAGVSDVVEGKVWSKLRYSGPGAPKPIRLNFHAWWKDEFRALVAALAPAASPPAAGPSA